MSYVVFDCVLACHMWFLLRLHKAHTCTGMQCLGVRLFALMFSCWTFSRSRRVNRFKDNRCKHAERAHAEVLCGAKTKPIPRHRKAAHISVTVSSPRELGVNSYGPWKSCRFSGSEIGPPTIGISSAF